MKTKPEHPYSPDKFDADYYGGKARGGFGEEIRWENPIQQNELLKKAMLIATAINSYNSILFIGCALGNEVRYFRQGNKRAYGVEISEYAVSNCHPTLKEYIRQYNGWDLSFHKSNGFDVVAAFDVLTLVPDDMLEKLVKEMCRVSRNKIIFRNIIDHDNSKNGEWIGNDGVTFRYLTLEQWRQLFEANKFVLSRYEMNKHFETIFVFSKI